MSSDAWADSWPFPPPPDPPTFPIRRRRRKTPVAGASGAPELNPRQERFCELYVATGNAAEAARGAGYSERAARFQGHRLLKDARVRARLDTLRTALADKIDASLILGRLENLYRLAERDGVYGSAARILLLMARMIGVDHSCSAMYLRSPERRPEPPLPSAVEVCKAWLAEHGPAPFPRRPEADDPDIYGMDIDLPDPPAPKSPDSGEGGAP